MLNNDTKKITALEIENRLIDFSVRVIKMAETLPNGVAPKHLAAQIIRSATSPALITEKHKTLNPSMIFYIK